MDGAKGVASSVAAKGRSPLRSGSGSGGSPVSPIAGGRSILTMLLERERSGSTASDTTIPAAGASSSTRQPNNFGAECVDDNGRG